MPEATHDPSIPALRPDPDHDYLVVLPTVGQADTLLPTWHRLLASLDGTRTLVVVVCNPVDPAHAANTLEQLELAWRASGLEGACTAIVHRCDGPVGWPKACNLGLQTAQGSHGIAPLVVLLNDDTDPAPGWLHGLRAALDSTTVRLWGEPPGDNGRHPDRPAAGYGRIGLVGPVCDNVAGTQRVRLPPAERVAAHRDPVGWAANFQALNPGNVLTADFLSGYCLGLSRECLADLVEWGAVEEGEGPEAGMRLMDERYGIGGYDDNDLAVRAELAGWRSVVAGGTWVGHRGHMTLDRWFPESQRGLANRLTYLRKWAEHPETGGRRLVAAYRLRLTFGNDLHYLRAGVCKLATLVDGIAVLLTGNPLEITQANDWAAVNGTLMAEDADLLRSCSGATADEVAAAFQAWIVATCERAQDRRSLDVVVDTWGGELNERTERNRAIELAEELGADWVVSVDHDEIPENRISRAYLDRLMAHPDPLVRAWDCGWLNHWDSPRLVRVDPPWADGKRYRTGMRGFRLWRVCKASPRRIQAGTPIGLHCGNAPDHDLLAKRVSTLRWRHYGYTRATDRIVKAARYRRLDPQPAGRLTTGTARGSYDHLLNEEGMTMVPYCEEQGIGLAMLCHAGEAVGDLARWLDTLHGVVDHAVLVWTDPWDEDAGTGPSADLLDLVELFGAELIHHQLDRNLAAARNAGLDSLRGRPGVGWALVVDPDEHLADPFGDCVALRRMAECSDAFGFLFSVANQRPSGTGEAATISECIRLIRLDPEGVMRYSGRVHEGFDLAIRELQRLGIHPNLRQAPFTMINRGLALDDVAMERKLRFYQDLLVLELGDRPDNGGAWVSLALQYANEGREADAIECLNRAVAVAGDGYLPYKELGLWHLRRARALFAGAVERLATGHSYHQVAAGMYRWLVEHAPAQPLVGLARTGNPQPQACPPLPPFPPELLGLPPEPGAEPPPADDSSTVVAADAQGVD